MGDFKCFNNYRLISLDGFPENIIGNCEINDNFKTFPEYQRYLTLKKLRKEITEKIEAL